MAAAYKPFAESYDASRIMVVALNRNTDVNVTDGKQTQVIHMNEGDVFQYDAPDYRDVKGCVIKSNNDVIVIAGSSLSTIPSIPTKPLPTTIRRPNNVESSRKAIDTYIKWLLGVRSKSGRRGGLQWTNARQSQVNVDSTLMQPKMSRPLNFVSTWSQHKWLIELDSYPLAAQMLPTGSYRYIVAPTEPKERMFVAVITDRAYNVTMINKTTTRTYTTEGPQMYELGTEPVSLLTSTTVTLAQYNRPFMSLVPGVNQYLNEYPFVVPDISSTPASLVAIVPRAVDSGLQIDGAPFNGTAQYIECVDDKYTVLTGSVEPGFHHMVHRDPNVRFGLLVYNRERESWSNYGFYVGMNVSGQTDRNGIH